MTSSCTARRNVVYLHDLPDSLDASLRNAKENFGQKIEKNDLLAIRINGLNPTDVIIVNPASSTTSLSSSGYLPDENGDVELPFIGKVHAIGLTRNELETTIHTRMKSFLQDPVVQVRFINNHVTVLGDVLRPGELRPNTERLTILEAIGEAGDLKVTGKRENVLVVRETAGKRKIARLDLTSKNLFTSPYFYLQNKDVVYVEPIPSSYSNRNDIALRYLGITASVISLLVSILLLVKR